MGKESDNTRLKDVVDNKLFYAIGCLVVVDSVLSKNVKANTVAVTMVMATFMLHTASEYGNPNDPKTYLLYAWGLSLLALDASYFWQRFQLSRQGVSQNSTNLGDYEELEVTPKDMKDFLATMRLSKLKEGETYSPLEIIELQQENPLKKYK